MHTLIRTLLVILLTAGSTNIAFSQQTQGCPRGIQDCKGLCGWYRDKDQDGYCDITLWSPYMAHKIERTADSLEQLAKAKAEKARQDSIAKINKNKKEQDINASVAEDLKQSNQARLGSTEKKQQVITPPSAIITQSPVTPGPPPPTKSKYDLILILFACVTLYIFTFLLARRDVIKKATHRKIWNTTLLLTFLASGLLGLFLTIQLNYNFKLDWFASLLYWHVEFGIAMAGISILHILWHLKYYLNLFSRPGGRIKSEK